MSSISVYEVRRAMSSGDICFFGNGKTTISIEDKDYAVIEIGSVRLQVFDLTSMEFFIDVLMEKTESLEHVDKLMPKNMSISSISSGRKRCNLLSSGSKSVFFVSYSDFSCICNDRLSHSSIVAALLTVAFS